MTAYYNENDAEVAAWLRESIAQGLVAPGDVDERSIHDVEAADLKPYRQCHFFAGIGGWSFALRRAGVADGARVWTGSCPCQPFSRAGRRRGFADERHLWPIWLRLIEKCRPAVIFGEQSPDEAGLAWIDLVQDQMEARRYAIGAAVWFSPARRAGRWRV